MGKCANFRLKSFLLICNIEQKKILYFTWEKQSKYFADQTFNPLKKGVLPPPFPPISDFFPLHTWQWDIWAGAIKGQSWSKNLKRPQLNSAIAKKCRFISLHRSKVHNLVGVKPHFIGCIIKMSNHVSLKLIANNSARKYAYINYTHFSKKPQLCNFQIKIIG